MLKLHDENEINIIISPEVLSIEHDKLISDKNLLVTNHEELNSKLREKKIKYKRLTVKLNKEIENLKKEMSENKIYTISKKISNIGHIAYNNPIKTVIIVGVTGSLVLSTYYLCNSN